MVRTENYGGGVVGASLANGELEEAYQQVGRLLEDALTLTNKQIQQANVRIRTKIAPDLSPILIVRDQVEQVFEPFFSTKYCGSGLGLAIGHEIVEALGGRLSAESRLGEGSTFAVQRR